jgi:hypothetical protein
MPISFLQADAALMYDAMSVLQDAFSKMTRKKPDYFSSGSPASSSTSSSSTFRWNGTRDVHCATGRDFTGSPTPFEMGERIAKNIRKVCVVHLCRLCGISIL